MVLEHPSITYSKCVATSKSIGWAGMTHNTIHIPLTLGPGYAKTGYIWGGVSYSVPFQWLKKATVMVFKHSFETYTKYVATPGNNGWAHLTLNNMHLPPDYVP